MKRKQKLSIKRIGCNDTLMFKIICALHLSQWQIRKFHLVEQIIKLFLYTLRFFYKFSMFIVDFACRSISVSFFLMDLIS